jgi:serine/threonine-protein kinase RsbW
MTLPNRYEQRFPAEARFVAPARQAVTSLARRAGMSQDAVGDLAIAVSEAITNGVMHALATFVDVEAETVDGALVVTITDDGVGMRPRLDSPGLGLGLTLMGRLCGRVHVGPGPDGKGTAVRMSFAIDR